MKTYEEALMLFARRVDSQDERDAAAAKMLEEIQRRASIGEDIDAVVIQIGELTNYSVNAVALSAFVMGVMIGMEMERDDSRVPEGVERC